MKKLTGLLVVFSLLLFVCICIPEFSNAQKLKPKALDANKPGVSKSVVKKPGPSNAQKSKPKAVDVNKPGTSKSTVKKPRLSSSIKAKLPALEVSRLALDPGCKITGFLQNKGSKIDAGHPDFSKIEIKVWYTFDGKTEEVLLRTNSGASADQPRLLANSHDMVNFVNGRPAKFTSKLKVPSTGKGSAAVFAEIDPSNKIRETSKGEQRKRIQKRLRSRCAPRLSPAVKVKMRSKKVQKLIIDPNTKKKVNIPVPSKIHSDNMVTKSGGTPISFSKPRNGEVFSPGAQIPVEFRYIDPVSEVIFLTYAIYCYKKQTGERVAIYYPIENIRVTEGLNPDGGSFEISSNIIREENLSDFFYMVKVWAWRSPIDLVASDLSTPFNFRLIEMGPAVNPVVMALIENPYYDAAPVSNGLQITVPGAERGFCTYADEIDFHYVCDIDDIPEESHAKFYVKPVNSEVSVRTSFVRPVPPLEGDMGIRIHRSGAAEDLRPGFYKIHGVVKDYSTGTILGTGSSTAFELKDWCPEIRISDEYSTPIFDGLQIIEPAGSEIFYPGSVLNIRYRVDTLVPDGATIQFNVKRDSPPHNIAVIRNVNIRSDGIAELPLLPIGNISWGNYRLFGYIKDISGNTLATGTSGVFRIEYHADTPSEGIEITSPTVADWYRSADQIVVRYNFRSCEEVMTEGIVIYLKHHYSAEHTDFFRRYTLFRGTLFQGIPLTASGTMSFDIPPASISDEPLGEEGPYRIEIYTDPARVPYPSEGCMALSESFRISR